MQYLMKLAEKDNLNNKEKELIFAICSCMTNQCKYNDQDRNKIKQNATQMQDSKSGNIELIINTLNTIQWYNMNDQIEIFS